MEVRPYLPEDFKQISEWARKGWNTEYQASQFPDSGFIVDGFAAYFIYKTNSSVCFLENLISNKYADAIPRKKAIELVISSCLELAKREGYTVAYATTDIPEVIVKAIHYGAIIKHKQALITKDLTDPSK